MKVWGITPSQAQEAIDKANTEFAGNIRFDRTPQGQGRAIRFTIRVKDSKGPGHRLGFNGRRMVAACWHAHKAVMSAIFAINPEARVKTGMADYKGMNDFNYSFMSTGVKNIGSQMQPLNYEDACDCYKEG